MQQKWLCLSSSGKLILFIIGFGLTLFLSDCGRMPPASWPWWTADDSAAVKQAISSWQNFLNITRVLEDTFRLELWAGLNYSDSSSRTGDTIYKIAHILRAWIEPGQVFRKDIYQFGVTVDTVSMVDTFCQVIYQDSVDVCQLHLEYDTLWVVGFRPDTIIDTSKTPPETTIVQKPSYVERRGFSLVQHATKGYNWKASRWLFLRRDTAPDTFYYSLEKVSGAYANIPSAEEAPQISRVILSKPGKVDTFFYAPRADGKGLTNLRPLDGLYQLSVNEELGISITANSPQDTIADKNRFFITIAGSKSDITAGAKSGVGLLRFSAEDTGYQHIYIEVLPVSNILYPNARFTGTIWAIPVRVVTE
ncbi:MAG: hypothetical protein ACUVUR_05870 [bacterium]